MAENKPALIIMAIVFISLWGFFIFLFNQAVWEQENLIPGQTFTGNYTESLTSQGDIFSLLAMIFFPEFFLDFGGLQVIVIVITNCFKAVGLYIVYAMVRGI